MCFIFISCTDIPTPAPKNSINLKNADGILGGELVTNQDAFKKHIVIVRSVSQNGFYEICSGTLLRNNIVLTAAHCVDKANTYEVVFSDNNDVDPEDYRFVRPVDRIAISPLWNLGNEQYQNKGDIALVRFVGPQPEGFTPVQILNTPALLKNGSQVLIAGYGVDSFQNFVLPIKVDEVIYDGLRVCRFENKIQQCYKVNLVMNGEGYLRKTHVIVDNVTFSTTEIRVNQTKGSGACHGDSGGPAFLEIDNKFYLWGITSSIDSINNDFGDCRRYSIYTNVMYFNQWMEDSIKMFLEK